MPELFRIKDYDLSLNINNRILRVISSADMTVRKGEIVGLIGESGCGKSMLWKSALRLADPRRWSTGGEVYLNGQQLDAADRDALLSARGKDVAVILQDPMNAFDQLFTIEQHFLETAKAHTDWSREEVLDKAVHLLERLYIHDPQSVLKMYPFQCSGGMLQRIMIALAMIMDTPLIIADEPTTSVDVTIQREIISMLREVNKAQNTGILYISHDLKIIETLADRVYVMYAGYMIETFPVEILRDGKALHPYTIKLLQSRPAYTRGYLSVLEGNPPSLAERQDGCPFAPRCQHVGPECRTFDMTEAVVGEEHSIRCCRWEALNGSDQH